MYIYIYANTSKTRTDFRVSYPVKRQTSVRTVREMGSEEQNRFRNFLIERTRILQDIRQFLRAVLLYFLDMEDNMNFQRDVIATKNASSLIESLCLIHGLYCYPAESNRSSVNTGIYIMIRGI
jgi:hypothetical protein